METTPSVGLHRGRVGVETDDVGVESGDVGVEQENVSVEANDVGVEDNTAILCIIRDNPHITATELATKLHITGRLQK